MSPIASQSIPLCTQQFPCLQVPRAVGRHGMAWSLHGRVREPMGVSGSSWEQSWEQCFLRAHPQGIGMAVYLRVLELHSRTRMSAVSCTYVYSYHLPIAKQHPCVNIS